MSGDEVLTGVVTSAVVGALSWGGGRFLSLFQRNKAGAPTTGVQPFQVSPGALPITQAPTAAVDLSRVLTHVAILQLVANVVGFAIGYLESSGGAPTTVEDAQNQVLLLLAAGTLTGIIFFYIIGQRLNQAVRWRHLTYVAIGTILASLLVNSVVYQLTTGTVPTFSNGLLFFLESLGLGLLQAFVAMWIGGGLVALSGPKGTQTPVPVAIPQPYPPAPGAPYPYGYGAPPSAPMYPMMPGAPVAAPMYPPAGPQYPPQPGMQPPTMNQPGWGVPPAAAPVAAPRPAYPPAQQPPTEQRTN